MTGIVLCFYITIGRRPAIIVYVEVEERETL